MIAEDVRQLQNDEKTIMLPNGTLIVNAVSQDDEGWYTCTATNKGKLFILHLSLVLYKLEINSLNS
jgi:hypothetical protein